MSQPLLFSEGRLVDAEGGAVMMGWEDGLMRHHTPPRLTLTLTL